MNIGTRLQVGQTKNCGSNPGMAKRFFFVSQSVWITFGIQLASLQWVLGRFPPIIKKLELEAVSSLASKNEWSYMHKSQVRGHLGNLILRGGV
jgi:hypothetical protein